jgi:nucleoside-diphosphate-sugar epimerase
MNHSMGTILVKGGNGYLGSMLVARLTQSGEQTGQDVVYGDIRDPRVVEERSKIQTLSFIWCQISEREDRIRMTHMR